MIEIKTLHLVQLFSLIQLLIAFVILHRARKRRKSLLVLKTKCPLSPEQSARLKLAAENIVGELGFIVLVLDGSIEGQIISSERKMSVEPLQTVISISNRTFPRSTKRK